MLFPEMREKIDYRNSNYQFFNDYPSLSFVQEKMCNVLYFMVRPVAATFVFGMKSA